MGAGKTEILVRAAARLGNEFCSAKIGMVAPTTSKLGTVFEKFCRILPNDWIVQIRERPMLEPPFVMLINRVKYQFMTASAPSKQKGTQIHGQDWVAAFIDEEEQVSDTAIYDVLSRGRDAPAGWYPVMSTCTISDDPDFRARYAKYKNDPNVTVYPMAITANPWVEQEYIDSMRRQMPPREFAQRFLAQEQPPARATYVNFDRDVHIRPLPEIGALDITRKVIGADYGIGHDPGELCDVSMVLKCYELRSVEAGRRFVERVWFVIGELTTERTTTEEHAAKLVAYLNDKFGAHRLHQLKDGTLELEEDSPTVTIRADPKGGSSKGVTSTATYRHFQKLLFDIRPAQYKRTTNPKLAHHHGTLMINDRIECINTLLLSAAGRTRLYLLADGQGNPVAEKLAQALEMSQRDEYGRPEMQRKDTHDMSHWPSGTAYLLWPYEKPHRSVEV
jgi:hypothetical protein